MKTKQKSSRADLQSARVIGYSGLISPSTFPRNRNAYSTWCGGAIPGAPFPMGMVGGDGFAPCSPSPNAKARPAALDWPEAQLKMESPDERALPVVAPARLAQEQRRFGALPGGPMGLYSAHRWPNRVQPIRAESFRLGPTR